MKSTKTQIKTAARTRQCLFKTLHSTTHSLLNAFIHHLFYIKLNNITQHRLLNNVSQPKILCFLSPGSPQKTSCYLPRSISIRLYNSIPEEKHHLFGGYFHTMKHITFSLHWKQNTRPQISSRIQYCYPT